MYCCYQARDRLAQYEQIESAPPVRLACSNLSLRFSVLVVFDPGLNARCSLSLT